MEDVFDVVPQCVCLICLLEYCQRIGRKDTWCFVVQMANPSRTRILPRPYLYPPLFLLGPLYPAILSNSFQVPWNLNLIVNSLTTYQIIYHIKPVIRVVTWIDFEMLLFAHMNTQNRTWFEHFFTIDASQSTTNYFKYIFCRWRWTDLRFQLPTKYRQEFFHVDQIIRETNIKPMCFEHVLK